MFSRIKRQCSNKYFLSITLLSFFIFIMLTSAILLCSMIANNADAKEEALALHLERLNSYARDIESKYNKILATADQLVSEKSIQDWISSGGGGDIYVMKTILEELNNANVYNEAVSSIEIYKASDGAVLSNYYGYNAGDNFIGYVGGRKQLYLDFMNNRNIKQICVSSDEINGISTPSIVLLNSIPVYNKKGSVAMVMNPARLLPQNADPTENIFIVDSSNPLIYFKKNDDRYFIPDDSVETFISKLLESNEDESMMTVEAGGRIYYSSYRSILNNKFKLMMAVPEEMIEVSFSIFSGYITYAFIMIIVLSTLCSFLIYHTASKPVRTIAENIRSRLSAGISRNEPFPADEIKYLYNTFEQIIKKNSEIEKIFEDNKEFFRENTLRNLIYGSMETDAMQFFGNDLHIRSCNNFAILLLNMEKKFYRAGKQSSKHIDPYFLKTLTDRYHGSYIKTGPGQYTILVNLDSPDDRSSLISEIKLMQDSIKEKCGFAFTICISSVKHAIEDIHLCFDEAQESMKYGVPAGNSKIIDCAEVQDRFGVSNSFSIRDGQIIIKKLRTVGEEEINRIIDSMIDKEKTRCSAEMLNAFMLYISSCIGQVGMEYNMNPEDIFDNDLFRIMIECDTVEEKKAYLVSQCRKIIEVRNRSQKIFKKLSGEIAIKYIEENYTRPISLEIVASELNMSASYLSRLVKQETGVNFNAFINRLRIEKAVELLKKSNYTIRKISASVGYDNEHTFIRNFKSFTGKTPAEYRNANLRTNFFPA